MDIIFYTVGGYFIALAVLKAKRGETAWPFAVLAWLAASLRLLFVVHESFNMQVVYGSASMAGMAWLGIWFGKWLRRREQSSARG